MTSTWKERVDHTFDPETASMWILLSQEVFWRTKENKVLPIDEMTDSHVYNTYKLLLRWEGVLKLHEVNRIEGLYYSAPDDILNDLDRWMDDIEDANIDEAPLMREFRARIQARKIRDLWAQAKAYKFGMRYSQGEDWEFFYDDRE